MKLRCPSCSAALSLSFTGEEEGVVGFSCSECNEYHEGEFDEAADFQPLAPAPRPEGDI
jgi:hypothetical protein